MKKVTLKDLNGKIIETYFASDHPNNYPTNMENHTVEDVPSDKNWFEMTGGKPPIGECGSDYDDPDHPLNKHDEGQTYWFSGDEKYPLNEQDVNENSAGGGAHAGLVFEPDILGKIPMPKGYEEEGKGKVWASLTKSFLNKVKLQESEGQIKVKIDDAIPSDFVDTGDLRLGSIYVVAGLGLTAKFVAQIMITENKTLLQMKRHGIVFYVEEGQLMKATLRQVDNYLNEPF